MGWWITPYSVFGIVVSEVPDDSDDFKYFDKEFEDIKTRIVTYANKDKKDDEFKDKYETIDQELNRKVRHDFGTEYHVTTGRTHDCKYGGNDEDDELIIYFYDLRGAKSDDLKDLKPPDNWDELCMTLFGKTGIVPEVVSMFINQ